MNGPPNNNGNMHQMQPGRGPPPQQNNMMQIHPPNQPPMNTHKGPPPSINQQQQPFPSVGHIQQPFNGQFNQQQQHQMQMNHGTLPMQQQQMVAGMPPLMHQQQQQQQVFPTGQVAQHQQIVPMMNQQGPPAPQIISPQHTQMVVPIHHQNTASPAAATNTAAPTADGWTEHRSPQGVPYYYNTITKVSTYERPTSMSQTQQNGAAAATGSASSSPSKSPTPASSSWNMYTDQTTGKKYYSNGVTTTWTRPAELGPDEADNATAAPATNNKRQSSSENETSKKKKRKGEKDDISLYANKAEAIAAFKGLLLAKDIAPTTKWNDVVRICSEDARWEACNTIGERKQALAEYQTKRANELRDVKRQEKARAKEAYQRLLTDILPTVKTFSPGSSRFMDVRDFLSKDDRFYAVEDENTREELFYDFVEEMRKREERTKRNKKREAKDAYLAFLKLREEEGKLTFASTW
jgi:pre-mRNA-processing factor 40